MMAEPTSLQQQHGCAHQVPAPGCPGPTALLLHQDRTVALAHRTSRYSPGRAGGSFPERSRLNVSTSLFSRCRSRARSPNQTTGYTTRERSETVDGVVQVDAEMLEGLPGKHGSVGHTRWATSTLNPRNPASFKAR